jgi:ubiquinone/menaquinone biosynthesis C-methylase UbiE
VGCGQGASCSEIHEKSISYIGIDPSTYLISRAQKNYPEGKFTIGNAYDLPFQDASIDGVFSIALWHLLSDINLAASELHRVLNPDGKFLIITADPESYEALQKNYERIEIDGKMMKGIVKNSKGVLIQDILYLHSMEEINKAFEDNGFRAEGKENFRNQIAIWGSRS